MKTAIEQTKHAFDNSIETAKTIAELEQIRIAFLGRHGSIVKLMDTLKTLPLEDKKIYGPLLNNFKQHCIATLEQKILQLQLDTENQKKLYNTYFDVTTSYPAQSTGTLHIYSQLIETLENIFINMGYTIADGPEVETDYYNFEALNIPAHHPARDMQDTFWLDIPGMLLRTHTSTVQIHAMRQQRPPLAIFAPGRVYRNEATDASHDFMFMQGECLFVDKNVSMANLLATARLFLRTFFNNETIQLRIRPSYFPFVEPGIEIDASCPFCSQGCSLCKYTRWIELLGAGLVHSHVLSAGDIDPDIYSGFAFGFGLDRLAMIKYNISDIRLLRSNKLSFLSQF